MPYDSPSSTSYSGRLRVIHSQGCFDRMLPTTREDMMRASGANLKAARRAFNLRQDYFTRYGIEQSRLSNWELGKRPIDVWEIQKFCQEYGISLDFIFLGKKASLSDTVRKRIEKALADHHPDPDSALD